MLTQIKSARRLKKSSKVSMSNLTPNGEKDFWKFYSKNSETINEIVTSQLHRIKYNVDPTDQKDILQDVLLVLHRNDVLEGYDPSKGAFNTYFTNTVRGYIQHWFVSSRKRATPLWRPEPTTCPDTEAHYKRVYCCEINGVNDNTTEESLFEIGATSNIENHFELRERLTLLKKRLPPGVRNVFNYILNGYSNTEIALALNTTRPNIGLKIAKIKGYAQSYC